MKPIIENIITVVLTILLSIVMITSIKNADTYTGEYNKKTNGEIWEQQARIERLTKGGI